MADTIDKLTKSGRVNQIQFLQQEDIIYPYDQTNILVEISDIILTIFPNIFSRK